MPPFSSLLMYPFLCLFIVSLLFQHVAHRNRFSLVAFLSLIALFGWEKLHRLILDLSLEFGSGSETPPLHVMGTMHEHPALEAFSFILSGVLVIAFCVSFFLSAVSMGTRKVDTAEGAARESFLVRICTLRNLSTPALWIGSGVALGTSYLMAYAHFNLNARGYHIPYGTLAGIASLLTLFAGILLPGIALRRRMSA